jgi:hypothetical protein
MLKKLIVFTMSLLLRDGTYRNALKHHYEANLSKPIAAFFRQKKFRRDFVDTLSKQLALRAQLPHYVVIIGHEVDQTVKYSLKSLLQCYFNKDYLMTLFEVPAITLNRIDESLFLRDKMLKPETNAKRSKKVNEQVLAAIKVETTNDFSANAVIKREFLTQF